MKRITVLLSVLMMLCLTACGGKEATPQKSASPSEVFAKMEEQVTFPDAMVQLGDEDLLNMFGFSADDFEEYVYAICEDGLLAETIVLIKVKEGKDTGAIRDTLNDYAKDQTMMFEQYVPEQAKVAGQAEVVVNGRYVYLIMSSKVKELKKIAKDMIGE